MQTNKKAPYGAELVYKPSSVLDGYLSRHIVANMLKRCMWQSEQLMCQLPCIGWGLQWRQLSLTSRWALTSPFQPYHKSGGVFSVVLSLKSPSLAVSKHPVLWCPDFPREKSRNHLANSLIFYTFFCQCQYFVYFCLNNIWYCLL